MAVITVLSVDETTKEVTPTGVADFVNQQAIVRFSLKQNVGSQDLVARELKVQVGTGSRIYTATLASPSSEVFLAIPEVSNKQVTLTATGDDGVFTRVVSGVTFTKGQYYDIGVKMTCTTPYVNLAKVSNNITVTDGQVLAGTLGQAYQISIEDGATVTLKNATIDLSGTITAFAGITCLGTATINLEGTNTVKAYRNYYPAIQAGPAETTLTIGGSGSLTVTGAPNPNATSVAIGCNYGGTCGHLCFVGGSIIATGGYRCVAIGASHGTSGKTSICGNITITGGHIIATGGNFSPAIGCSHSYSANSSRCGNITISGGTVEATGGVQSAAIGCSNYGSCGDIIISGGTGTATKGAEMGNVGADCAIGQSNIDGYGSTGTITIAVKTYYNGSTGTFISDEEKAFLMQNSISWGD